MKKKLQYNAPEMEIVKVKMEGCIATSTVSSVEKVHEVEGEWD